MPGLSDRTWKMVRKMFSARQQEEVRQLLEVDCGNNLPFCENLDEVGLERVRFAVLKLSNGRLDALRRAIQEAQRDWRDTLMAAGFGFDVTEHNRWADNDLSHNTCD